MSLAGASVSMLKKLLEQIVKGEEPKLDLSEEMINSIAGLWLLNRYSLEKGITRHDIMSSIVSNFVPPVLKPFNAVFSDTWHAFEYMLGTRKDLTYKTMQHIPVVGKPLYNITPERGQTEHRILRKEISDAIEDRDIELARKLVNRYNQDAKKYQVKRLSIGDLVRDYREKEANRKKELMRR
jgi:hypothetical protein